MNLQIRALLIIVLSTPLALNAIHPLFNPFAWYKSIKKAYAAQTRAKDKAAQQDILLKLYDARYEVEQLAKIYKATQVAPLYGYWKKPPLSDAQKRDALLLEKRFKEMQKAGIYALVWGQYCSITNIDEYKKKLAKKIADFEKDPGMKSISQPQSWYQQLKSKLKPLKKSESRAFSQNSKKEFREWQNTDSRSFKNQSGKTKAS